MMQSWVGQAEQRKPFALFSYADRADVWPTGTEVAAAIPDLIDFDSIAEGLVAGTLIATEMGWQAAETLRAGDRVVTFDNGMRPLRGVRVSSLWTAESGAPRTVWPLLVPEKALGNRNPMLLLPEQLVLIESDEAEEMFGDPFALVSAASLEGYNGIKRVPPSREIKVVTLQFDDEEVVYANGTALIHCPRNGVQRVASAEEMMDVGSASPYHRPARGQCDQLMQALRAA